MQLLTLLHRLTAAIPEAIRRRATRPFLASQPAFITTRSVFFPFSVSRRLVLTRVTVREHFCSTMPVKIQPPALARFCPTTLRETQPMERLLCSLTPREKTIQQSATARCKAIPPVPATLPQGAELFLVIPLAMATAPLVLMRCSAILRGTIMWLSGLERLDRIPLGPATSR